MEANEQDWQEAREYSYSETTRDLPGSRTKRVILLFGSPYERLLKVNGKLLSPKDEEKETAISLRLSPDGALNLAKSGRPDRLLQ